VKYTGDTPAKKIARLAVWTRVRELLGSRFLTGTHVVLLSSEAGDVSTLLGLGVVIGHIIGVDIDPHAIAAAKNKYPDLRCLKEDVAAAIERLNGEGLSPSSVFLDFCGPMKPTTVGKAIEVAGLLGIGSVLILGVKMGREKDEYAEEVNLAKAGVSAGSRTFYIRTGLLTKEFLTKANGHKYRAEPTDFYRYSSWKVTEQRSEMLVCVSRISAKKELKDNPLVSANQITRKADYSSIIADHRTLGPIASRLAARGEDAHLLLNLKPESIPAYKAHRTRGTYEGARTPIVHAKRPS
jgi:hypothetical protein